MYTNKWIQKAVHPSIFSRAKTSCDYTNGYVSMIIVMTMQKLVPIANYTLQGIVLKLIKMIKQYIIQIALTFSRWKTIES